MTKIWCQSGASGEYTQARIISEEWFESDFCSVFDCKPVTEWFPNTTLEIISEHPPADFFDPGTMFTVSDRLKSLLEEFSVHAEFFPLHVLYEGTEFTERSFYYCNI